MDCLIRDRYYTTTEGVVSIRLLKRDTYWDMFVPFYNNYLANGIVNHNSAKSTFVSEAIVLGLERDWQECLDRKLGRNGMGIGRNRDRPDPYWYRYLTNAIVYRKVGNTLADSVYNQFLQSMGDYMGNAVTDHWEFKRSPLRIVNKISGQQIMFRGLDDPLKSKSIKPPKGYFRYLWLEELAEYDGIEEIRSVRQSIVRGKHRSHSFYSYNPPETASIWVNDEASKDVVGRKHYKSNYLAIADWLGEDFIAAADDLKKRNFRQWRHEYMGEVTGNGGTIFPNIVERDITDEEIRHFDAIRYGVDFGYAIDPAAFVALYYDKARRRVIFFDEIYEKNLLNSELARRIKEKTISLDWVICDSAEPKSIAELQGYGVNSLGAKKGPDSVKFGIKFLQSMNEIVIDKRRTPNVRHEFIFYEYEKDKSGEFVSRYPDVNNHTIDGTRYALEQDMVNGGLF